MSLIPRKTLTVERTTGSGYINGQWNPGTTSSFTIKASVQPITGRDLEALPQGRRESGESYSLFTSLDTILFCINNNENPDIVTIYGQKFEVYSISRWENHLINHFEYSVLRKTTK